MSRHFYMLYVHVDSLDTELIERYKTNFEKQRLKVDDYLTNDFNESLRQDQNLIFF